jgi:2'-5' RNA ligase
VTLERGPHLRLFVAIELPSEWLEALRAMQELLRRGFEAGPEPRPLLRWVRPEGIHVTLKFLGATPESMLPEVEAGLRRAVPHSVAATILLDKPGMFPDRGSPRVLWAGVTGDFAALGTVAARIDAEMAKLGFEIEKRPFAPHLTLARVAEGSVRLPRIRYEEVIASVAIPRAPPLQVDRISLIRSHLGPGGARYERLAGYPP